MKTYLLALYFLFDALISSANDSIRVSICTHTNSMDCNGFDRYSTTVQRFNPDGTLKSQLEYRFRTCPTDPPDTSMVLESSAYYLYDSAHRLIDRVWYSEGETYVVHWVHQYNSNGAQFDVYVEEGVPGGTMIPNSHDSVVFDLSNRPILSMNLRWNCRTNFGILLLFIAGHTTHWAIKHTSSIGK